MKSLDSCCENMHDGVLSKMHERKNGHWKGANVIHELLLGYH